MGGNNLIMQLDFGEMGDGRTRELSWSLMEWIFRDVSKKVNLYKLYLSV